MRPWLIDGDEINFEAMTRNVVREPRPMANEELTAIRAAEPDRIMRRVGRVAVLTMHGPLTRRYDFWSYWMGGTSMTGFAMALQRAIDDSDVEGILVSVDSPGGTYDGTPELAERIRSQRGAKGSGKIVAVADSMAGSAAYWLASQFERLEVAPSGMVGSIGTLVLHHEMSRMLDQIGITPTIVRDPEKKADINMVEPLSDDARAYLQMLVSEITAEFHAAVAAARGLSVSKVKENFGQGRMVRPKPAMLAGMVDGISEAGQVVTRLAAGRRGVRPRATAEIRAEAAYHRRRLALDTLAKSRQDR
jgi:capsid assembly protease